MEHILSVKKLISTEKFIVPPSALAADNHPNVSVVFATRGRADILESAIKSIKNQTFKAYEIIVSCVSSEDHGNILHGNGCHVIYGKAGLPAQRNSALKYVSPFTDIIVFFDDDFIAHEAWLEEIVHLFHRYHDIDVITGTVIADGIHGVGYTEQEALAYIKKHPYSKLIHPIAKHSYSPYGCNMAFRFKSIAGLKFDERLVLYGWQEDRDFGSQVATRGGQLVKSSRALGVHMGVKKSRTPGKRLGYSQVVNPAYMFRKGTMPLLTVLKHVTGNVLSNFFRSIYPESYVDRIGRLKGNIIGFKDLIRGKLTPERAEEL